MVVSRNEQVRRGLSYRKLQIIRVVHHPDDMKDRRRILNMNEATRNMTIVPLASRGDWEYEYSQWALKK